MDPETYGQAINPYYCHPAAAVKGAAPGEMANQRHQPLPDVCRGLRQPGPGGGHLSRKYPPGPPGRPAWIVRNVRPLRQRDQYSRQAGAGQYSFAGRRMGCIWKDIFPAIPILRFSLLSLITTLPGCRGRGHQENGCSPASGLSPGWALEGPIKKYTGEDLFEYINGEAELYLQLGLKSLPPAFT